MKVFSVQPDLVGGCCSHLQAEVWLIGNTWFTWKAWVVVKKVRKKSSYVCTSWTVPATSTSDWYSRADGRIFKQCYHASHVSIHIFSKLPSGLLADAMSPATIKALNEPAPSSNVYTHHPAMWCTYTVQITPGWKLKKILNFVQRYYLLSNENLSTEKCPTIRTVSVMQDSWHNQYPIVYCVWAARYTVPMTQSSIA